MTEATEQPEATGAGASMADELLGASIEDIQAAQLPNLLEVVKRAYDQALITKSQTVDEVVFTIRIPRVQQANPTLDLFHFASAHAV